MPRYSPENRIELFFNREVVVNPQLAAAADMLFDAYEKLAVDALKKPSPNGIDSPPKITLEADSKSRTIRHQGKLGRVTVLLCNDPENAGHQILVEGNPDFSTQQNTTVAINLAFIELRTLQTGKFPKYSYEDLVRLHSDSKPSV